MLANPSLYSPTSVNPRVTLSEKDLLVVAQIARPWWRWVNAKLDVTDAGLLSLSNARLASLAAGCTAITTLDLAECNRVTDAGLACLAVGCTAITTLDLSYCIQITDAGLLSLAGCTAITTLSLSGLREVTDAGLLSLAAGCTTITSLRLVSCEQITEAGLASLRDEYPNIHITK